MDSVLRPRDIQARIRSGESPETVAAAAQTTVDKIVGFATPVLAERAYVAQQAQKASVRRRAGDGPVGHLGQAVEERLASRGIEPEAVEWDAWRREDGRWTLVADYGSGAAGTRAHFVYDAAGRYVVAEDEESRWLVGERSTTETPALPTVEPLTAGRRLASVPTAQVSLGDDAIEVVTGRRPEPELVDEPVETPAEPELGPVAEESTVDLTETASAIRSVGTPAEPDALFDAPVPLERAPVDEQPTEEPARDRSAAEEPAPEATVAEQKERRPARSRGRASVPSWDEIMFGSSGGE
jgi:hypothetical protein